MNNIAYCGYDCTKCPIYQASIKNDIQLLKILSYSNDNVDINKIKCLGCLENNQNKYCMNCNIRLCAKEKKVTNCGKCDFFPCDNLKLISPNTFDVLKKINKEIKK